jgi:hypothetical protein
MPVSPKRPAAAALIRGLRDARITNNDFEEDWPYDKADRALQAIGDAAWTFYDDFETHTLEGLGMEGHDFLTRCALFLDTGLEYEWPEGDVTRFGGLGLLVPLTLGLLWPLDRWLRARSNQRYEAYISAGAEEAWPFLRTEDLVRSRSTGSPASDQPGPNVMSPPRRRSPFRFVFQPLLGILLAGSVWALVEIARRLGGF